MDLLLANGAVLPESELRVETSRASGPGGQHVNKTETRVTLRWSLADSALSGPLKQHLRSRLAPRLTKTDELLVSVDDTRVRSRNLVLARERMKEILDAASKVPKKRQPTRPTKGSKERRLRAKRAQADKKSMRRKPIPD
ncbi:MAG: alternative ribosome rescue aminoacyl-tRNA hydrolase ArfB [Myxococcota bacterium]